MLVLHHSHTSPYARKVMIVLHETGQLDQVSVNPVTVSPVAEGSLPPGANPLGKVPALERPDGCTLYDSRVICRWLVERVPAQALYPAAPRLYESLTLEATGDGILDAALLLRYEITLRPEALRWDAWSEGQWGKIARSLDALEARWMGHLAGPFCIGQAAVAAALGYLDLRFGDREWRTGRPALSDWEARIAGRPSVQATRPPEG